MLNLYTRTSALVSILRRTLLLVIEREGHLVGTLIDQVLGLRNFCPESLQEVSLQCPVVWQMALSSGIKRPISLLDAGLLYDRARSKGA